MGKTFNNIKFLLLKNSITRLPLKALMMLPDYGLITTCKMAWYKLQKIKPFNYSVITDERRKREENTQFPKNIKFSILVPLYNTPNVYLKEMIDSVRNQTYANWELCLADGSDSEHSYVEQTVRDYMASDKRIVYKKLEKNQGISANTNACIELATGDYIALFDHDDYLHPSALYENMKVICEEDADFIYTDEAVFKSKNISKIITFHFKPDFAIDNLRANNYICHFSVFSRELLDRAGWFRSDYDGSQDFDIILRLTKAAKKVCHIPKLLYFWRSHPNSVASDISSKTYAIDAGRNAVIDYAENSNINCKVESSKVFPTIYRITYELNSNPDVSVVITNINSRKSLEKCVDSVLKKTTYKNYDIVLLDDGNTNNAIREYYDEIANNEKIRIIKCSGNKDVSSLYDLGVDNSDGEYVVLLDSDTEVITPEWIEELLMYAQRSDVGAVGAKLYYSDNTIRHAGLILGLGKDGIAGISHYKLPKEHLGYMGKLYYSQNVSAVSAACMMFKKEAYKQVDGFDSSFDDGLNNVDFCLKLREKGLLTVFNPYSELYQHKSKKVRITKAQKERKNEEISAFKAKWGRQLQAKDPYYNPNFSLDTDYKVLYKKLQKDCCK